MFRKLLLAALLALAPSAAFAASAILYFESTGCESGSTVRCSGTTDSASATVSSASATITCSAVAGPAGAPGCSLSGSPSLAGIATDGSQAIFVNCATNSNQKIFFINAIDDGGDLVGTTVTPTGCTAATSAWGIGGRMILTPANWEAGIRAGDIVQFNDSPASRTTAFITARVAGDQTAYVTVRGKAGASRPVFTITSGTAAVIDGNSTANWRFKFLQLTQDGGATGNCLASLGASGIVDDLKITNCPSNGITITSTNVRIFNTEITGADLDGINISQGFIARGLHIHDVTGDCIEASGTGGIVISDSVLDTCGARGINLSSASVTTLATSLTLLNTTIYGSGGSGIRAADADWGWNFANNLVVENGNAAGEFNVDFASAVTALLGQANHNLFYHSNCEGSASSVTCVSNYTLSASDLDDDPLFNNAAGGDFTLQTLSPARAAGYPGVLLGGNTGYRDIGPLQHQDSGGSSAKPHVFGG
jgi:hypothetical protein